MKANDILRAGADTYEERNKLYEDNYKRIGPILKAFFPNGIDIQTPEQHIRYQLFCLILVKLTRYANLLLKGGHLDSAHDAMVYAAMLEETDRDVRNAP